METEQGMMARSPKPSGRQTPLPFYVEPGEAKDGILPLESNALALQFSTLRPSPELALRWPEQAQAEPLDPPSVVGRRLRARLGELVAAQAVEDEAGRARLRGWVAGAGQYHRYNAVLKC